MDPQGRLAEQALREVASILKDVKRPHVKRGTKYGRSTHHLAWAAKAVVGDALEQLKNNEVPTEEPIPPPHPDTVSPKDVSWGRRIA